MTDNSRLAALLTAERKAEALLEAIESQRLVRPGGRKPRWIRISTPSPRGHSA